jgi:hypothetical protein
VLLNMLVADGTVADTTAAQAYVATQTDAQIQAYLRSKTPNELLTMVLTRLAPIGASGAGPIPKGTVLPVDPVAEILAGRLPESAGARWQHPRRRQAVPELPRPLARRSAASAAGCPR